MSTKIKKRLQVCKERGERVAAILATKKNTADVTEFHNTIKFVNSVLDDYLKSKEKERPAIPDEGLKIELLMKGYEDLLNQLVSTGRFLRFFTSNRVRKNLDNINSQLHKEISQLFLSLQANRRNSKKGSKKMSKAELETERQTECIRDEEGRQLWETNFGQVSAHLLSISLLIYSKDTHG
jgi:hypothetical protein